MTHPAPTYQFDDFEVDLENRQLRRAGETIALSAKYFDVLSLLIRRRGLLTTKEYLFSQVWNDVVVTDSALSQCIKDIRRQLGDNAIQPRYIKTIPKHGFIFISPVIEKTPGVKAVDSEAISNGIEKRPYKFLDYFTEQDEGLFFGREKEIGLICSKVQSHRSFIVHGRSGVGKSSLARAGLTPALRRQGGQIFIIRSFKDPLEEMVQALSESSARRSNASA
jgi:DNA-binding winged helix-turn-helix (wHTH) protein